LAEIRVDPLSGHRAIVAGERAGRPGAGLTTAPADPIDPASDPFAEGHEDRTPPEVWALRPGGGAPDGPGWTVRAFPNLYPALEPGAPTPEPSAAPELFTALAATGHHEVIVNAPEPVTSLAALPVEQVELAVEAGASLPHTHAQLYALDFVPQAVARERERFGAYAIRTMGGNLLADLVQAEVRIRDRIVAIDDDAVLMAPYGSRLPYQLLLAPRRARARFEDDGPTGARLLHDGLSRLARRFGAPPPLNLWVRTAPRDAEHFAWRIDVLPRLTNIAGLELGTGVHMNIVAPEQAAAELREA
jgi:UDPglucose--hexose-1-phosphate uridylyltransferase